MKRDCPGSREGSGDAQRDLSASAAGGPQTPPWRSPRCPEATQPRQGSKEDKNLEILRAEWRCGTFGEHKVNGRCLMKVSQVSEQLVLHWIPVVDPSGESHLEAVWTTTTAAVPTGHAA